MFEHNKMLFVLMNAGILLFSGPAVTAAENQNPNARNLDTKETVRLIHDDPAASGLPGTHAVPASGQEIDGHRNKEDQSAGRANTGISAHTYRNGGGEIFRKITGCTITDGDTTFKGDQSAGVAISSSSPVALWVQNLTSDISPTDSVPGIDVTATYGEGSLDGPPVEVHFLGDEHAIVTAPFSQVPGISASSQAGNGGKGRNGTATVWPFYTGHSADPGGAGGRGSDILIENQGTIETKGAESPGILAVSQGGNGGSGGNGPTATFRYGARGGKGGDGGAVTVLGNQNIVTDEHGAHGIIVLSQGGGGGNGGDSVEEVGGIGGEGGAGGTITILGNGNIETKSDESHGIYVRSEGGRGGNGGDGGWIGDSGDGAGGGHGGTVTVDGDWSILNGGNNSYGIAAYSLGGGGGKGGHGGWFDGGGKGGESGYGGRVTVNTRGSIQTLGDSATGIIAQSIGGYAGTGGGSSNPFVNFSANGGSGGAGGVVTVHNEAVISTGGSTSDAIMAQSIGGGGGNGGGGFGLFYSEGGEGSAGGNGDSVMIINSASLTVEGIDSRGIFAQSIGGGGGNGGSTSGGIVSLGGKGSVTSDGGIVSVINSGTIMTGIDSTDDERPQATFGSQAIFAQSIGGGGGNGGSSGGWFSIGGRGGGGGDAGGVSVLNTGQLSTRDDNSSAIFAQSIGGGGGNGGGSTSAAGILATVAIGGSGAGGGDGDTVSVSSHDAPIITEGDNSHGILAQSVGGGGGNGGFGVSASSAPVPVHIGIGGTAGSGGHADIVQVMSGSDITTSGSDAHGVVAQSIGGGGGTGGFSVAASILGGVSLNLAIGGDGNTGGNGNVVTVGTESDPLQGLIQTSGRRSHGILAQSIGGGGGSGGLAVTGDLFGNATIGVGLGGSGGSGGRGEAVNVISDADIITAGESGCGVLAQSIGGGGGSGGWSLDAGVTAFGGVTVGIGGKGGPGTQGGSVDVNSTGTIRTSGNFTHGIMAQSIGGGGGTGGLSGTAMINFLGLIPTEGTPIPDITVNLGISIGGDGGNGAIGDSVRIMNEGDIFTGGDFSQGIVAQSIGGGGGAGGQAIAVTATLESPFGKASEKTISEESTPEFHLDLNFTSGGDAGNGNRGGAVELSNHGNIETRGEGSEGIFAQSIGGGGGIGGLSANIVAMADNYLSLGLGGDGGNGSEAGTVDVMNTGGIWTYGNRSSGVVAQSVGGRGGNGGANYTAGGIIGKNSLSVSIGGDGGQGGHGSFVDVGNTGAIYTEGNESHGIHAQSVGGGGGNGGISANFPSLPSLKASITGPQLSSLNLGVSVGGDGGAAGNGSKVDVENNSEIVTTGAISHAIFAQSIGGGGGNGAAALLGTGGFLDSLDLEQEADIIDNVFTIWDPSAFGAVTVGGDGGANGHGDTVNVVNTGDISTHGYSSHGIFAQSIGGGGGTAQRYAEGGNADAGLIGLFSLGGDGGASGDGGMVSLVNDGSIYTSGEAAYGIMAQSIGGGGGMAGNVARGLSVTDTPLDLDIGLGLGIGGDGSNGGEGGEVSVANTSDITTLGDGSIGIFAQSIGGGGGLGGGVGNFDQPILLSFAGSTGGAGSGGTVSVVHEGVITTAGNIAHGIFAQSAGGEDGITDTGGQVNVSISGDILVMGEEAHGILTQSIGGKANGDILIDITEGTVQGGTGTGTGVFIMDGANNVLTNHGIISTLEGMNGWAVRGTGGYETVNNYGTISGSINLGSGMNYFNNYAGSLFEAGSVIILGSDGILMNDGTFSPGGADQFMTTVLYCDFNQTASGTFEASLCGDNLDRLIVADGSAALDGTLKVVAECGVYVDSTNYDIIQSPEVTGYFSNVILPQTAFLDFDMDYAESGVRLSVHVKRFTDTADNPVEKAIAGCIDACSPDATGDMAQIIGAFQLATTEQVKESFANLSSDTYNNLSRGPLQSMQLLQNILTQRMDDSRSNPFKGGNNYAGRNGVWLSGAQQGADQDESSGYLEHNFASSGVLTGYERSMGSSIIGLSVGTTRTHVDRNNDKAKGTVDGFAGAVYGGHLWGKSFMYSVFSYADESFKNQRDVHVGPLTRIADGNYGGSTLSAILTGGRQCDAGSWRFEPFVSVRYARLNEEKFTEEGAGSANLIVESRTMDWLSSDLGIRLSRNFPGERKAFVPELLLSWNHDFNLENDRPIIAAFEGDPSATFTMNGQNIRRDGVTFGIGFTYLTNSGWKAGLRYHRVQRSDYRANSLTVSLGSAF